MGNFMSNEYGTDWRDGQWISTTRPNGKKFRWYRKTNRNKNRYNSNVIKKKKQI